MPLIDTPAAVRRMRFASFDGKDEGVALAIPAPLPAAPPAPLSLALDLPAITEKDLAAARAEAQSQGYREGYSAAQSKFDKEAAAREEAVKSLLEVIANRITFAAEAHQKAMKENEAIMAKLIIAAARKVAGEALRREPYAPVESLIKECMALIAGKPKVTVVVATAYAAGLRQRIDLLKPLLRDFTGELSVEEDASLLDQDCRVEWGNGQGERDGAALWQHIETIIAGAALGENPRL